MMQPVLKLSDVAVERHEQKILSGVNFTAHDGDFIMLIGPNGSGKSTLMKTINGMIKPNHGRIVVNGDDVTHASMHEIAKHVSTLTQDVQGSTFNDLTVAMNLDLACERAARKLSFDEKRDYLAHFNETLKERMNVAAGKISGGQRQALALAMCLVHTPKVLLLDEHTSALDPKAAKHLMKVTNDYVKKSGITTVMISHHLEHVLHYGNRLVVINEGRIVADLDQTEKEKLTMQDLIAFAY